MGAALAIAPTHHLSPQGSCLVTVGKYIQMGLRFTRCRQWPRGSIITHPRDHQLLGGKACDDLTAIFCYHELLLDARRRPPVGCRPECLESKDHTFFDYFCMIKRNQPAEDRLLPDSQAHAMTVLECEGSFFVRETKFLCLRPQFHNFSSCDSRLNRIDGNVQDIATVLIGIHHRLRGAPNGKRAVIAGAIAIITMQDIKVGGIAWA